MPPTILSHNAQDSPHSKERAVLRLQIPVLSVYFNVLCCTDKIELILLEPVFSDQHYSISTPAHCEVLQYISGNQAILFNGCTITYSTALGLHVSGDWVGLTNSPHPAPVLAWHRVEEAQYLLAHSCGTSRLPTGAI